MLIYAYRNNRIDYLAMDFDPVDPKKDSGFSITMAVVKGEKIDLEIPEEGEWQIEPQVQDWVDALTIANQLCQQTKARLEFNAC